MYLFSCRRITFRRDGLAPWVGWVHHWRERVQEVKLQFPALCAGEPPGSGSESLIWFRSQHRCRRFCIYTQQSDAPTPGKDTILRLYQIQSFLPALEFPTYETNRGVQWIFGLGLSRLACRYVGIDINKI